MFRRGSWCLLGWIYFFVMVILSNILPSWVGEENGIIENLQLVVLAYGVYYCLKQRCSSVIAQGSSDKFLWSGMAIYFFILFMREISWGEEIFSFINNGCFRFSDIGISRGVIHTVVALFILAAVLCLYKGCVFTYIRIVKLPIVGLFLLACFILMQWEAEKGKALTFFLGELAEELAETGAYGMMIYLLADSLKMYSIRKSLKKE